VARELGISERHLSRQTQAALAKLREELERGGQEPATPDALAGLRRSAAPRPNAGRGAASATETGVARRYLDLPYRISVLRDEGDGGGWNARVAELPGCEARGASLQEAVQGIRSAMQEWIASALASEQEVPVPRRAPSHSGRVLLRMPQSLHAELARAAEQEEMSLNNFIASSLASALEAPGPRRPAPAAPRGSARSESRLLPLALATSTVLVLAAGVIAVIVLVLGWQQGW
jgi:antitoxin HicB